MQEDGPKAAGTSRWSILGSLLNELSIERWKNDYVLSILLIFAVIYALKAGVALSRGQSLSAVRDGAVAGLFFVTFGLCVVLPWIAKRYDERHYNSKDTDAEAIVRACSETGGCRDERRQRSSSRDGMFSRRSGRRTRNREAGYET